MKNKTGKILKISQQKAKCQQFINNFESFGDDEFFQKVDSHYDRFGQHKYKIMLQKIANGELGSFEVAVKDIEEYFQKEQQRVMVQMFKTNTNRYMHIFASLTQKMMPKRDKALTPQQELKTRFENILKQQRMAHVVQSRANQIALENQLIPYQAHMGYDISIVNGNNAKFTTRAIHQLTSSDIGSLVTLKAIVLRATEVKPEILIATYTCDVCGCQNYVLVNDGIHKPLEQCNSKKCMQNQVKGKLTFLPGHSKFQSYQQIKVQQTPDQIEMGAIPKSLTIKLKGSSVNTASPGDIITVQGILLPHRKNGFSHQYDLIFNIHIVSNKITRQKKKYIEMDIKEQDINRINAIRSNTRQNQLFDKMARSIAPNIYGLQDVKKSLLLQMVGGVTKQTHDRMKIRGQINIALIGDPGIAKSQLLKHISKIAPRGVYSTGKGSSGVGLTAAIVIDPNSRQTSLEAGALVLADMGICCIDQFDKMDQYDRTAIHQVMQQQTVSIAKAGITTTLNARCAILAAANPLYGRYNKKQSPHKNINMPAALLSRFDLVFILLDKNDKEKDLELAKHIGTVHQTGKSKDQDKLFDEKILRNYIAMAKSFQPIINQRIADSMTKKYIDRRQEEAGNAKQGQSYTTTRSLLAIVRMCQARARLRFSNQVTQSDLQECIKLFTDSQNSIIQKNQQRKQKQDYMSVIFQIIKSMCDYSQNKQTSIEKVQARANYKGFSKEDVKITMTHYENIGVLMVYENKVMLVE